MTQEAKSGGFDLPRIERAVTEILLAIGEDPDRDGLRDTPARVARAYAEQFAGLGQHRRTCSPPFSTRVMTRCHRPRHRDVRDL